MEWLKQKAMIYALFQCIDFLNFFCMITAFLISQCIYGYEFFSLSKEEFTYLLLEIPFYMIGCGVIFYMLQRRELKNFFAERRAQLKQEQVTTIFDSQSDAIVAIEKHSTGVLFNNKKSVSLFDYDFQSEYQGEESEV